MKVVLLALNASYSHTSLAARYLQAACFASGQDLTVVEMTANERSETISREVFAQGPDVLCCSVYIWNVSLMIEVCARLRLMLPGIRIIWGGPEVVGDEADLCSSYPVVDHFCIGEGEVVLPSLLSELASGGNPGRLCGDELSAMSWWPDAYADLLTFDRNRIYYVESSRGCPYSCAYCLSSRRRGVRYLPEHETFDRVRYLAARVPLLKFVDRTFNADPARARRLWRLFMALPGDCRFHFEICANLLSEEDFSLLAQPEASRLQFEIGLQSASQQVLANVKRRIPAEDVLNAVRTLTQMNTVEVHLDLIAGLPGENYQSFIDSLDKAMDCNPHRLHLGFLKILPGTEMRKNALEYGMYYLPSTPYEVLRTRDFSAGDLVKLKEAAANLDVFYNSRRFTYSMSLLLEDARASHVLGCLPDNARGEPLGGILAAGERLGVSLALLRECLLLDFLLREHHRQAPEWLRGPYREEELLRRIVYGAKDRLFESLPHRVGQKPGLVLRDLRLGVFSGQLMALAGYKAQEAVVLVDHSQPEGSRIFPLQIPPSALE